MEWLWLIVPIIGTIIVWKYFDKHLSIIERFASLILVMLMIISVKSLSKIGKTSDVEYWGSLITKVEYYEYYETWVEQTCSRTYSCNCDSKGNCQTCIEYYDCSYCDENYEQYVAYDNIGNSWGITKEKYNQLIKQWKSTPKFVELNRNIKYHNGLFSKCGQDGDMYYITWNEDPTTSEPAVTDHYYKNKVQATKSAFSYEKISEEEAKQLYEYPEKYDFWRQNTILGLDSLNIANKKKISQMFQYWNGYHGPKDKVKVFILLFYTKDPLIAKKQEAYWIGGNKNELVICIGIDKNTSEIYWVRPFSWSDNKRVIVDAREEISNMHTMNFDTLYNKLDLIVEGKFKYKNFDDFDYLTIDTPKWANILIGILSILITIGVSYFIVINEFNKDF